MNKAAGTIHARAIMWTFFFFFNFLLRKCQWSYGRYMFNFLKVAKLFFFCSILCFPTVTLFTCILNFLQLSHRSLRLFIPVNLFIFFRLYAFYWSIASWYILLSSPFSYYAHSIFFNFRYYIFRYFSKCSVPLQRIPLCLLILGLFFFPLLIIIIITALKSLIISVSGSSWYCIWWLSFPLRLIHIFLAFGMCVFWSIIQDIEHVTLFAIITNVNPGFCYIAPKEILMLLF